MNSQQAKRQRRELDRAFDLGYLRGKQAQYEAMESATQQRMRQTAKTIQKDAVSAYLDIMNALPWWQRLVHGWRLFNGNLR